MKNLFGILPEDFFKPLTSKYRRQYADCILIIFNTFKPEISYGEDYSETLRYMLEHDCKLEQEALYQETFR